MVAVLSVRTQESGVRTHIRSQSGLSQESGLRKLMTALENSTGSKCGARNNTDEWFVFIFKKVNGSFEPFTAFKRIDVLDKFTNQYVVQMFKIEASIFQVFFTT